MTDKQIRDEALRQVMWRVGITCNPVTQYISDAVAKQVVADESREEFEKTQSPVGGCSGM